MDKTNVSEIQTVEARRQYDWSLTRPSDAVLELVASLVPDGPTSFGPLYDRIDSDALDAIFRSDGSDRPADGTSVSFHLADRLVAVHGSGEVVVRATDRDGTGG